MLIEIWSPQLECAQPYSHEADKGAQYLKKLSPIVVSFFRVEGKLQSLCCYYPCDLYSIKFDFRKV